jgi:hypothetical protein
LLVDMGYTDRANLNPEKPVQFSLITPPGKILETVAGVPGALGQGVTNAVSGVESIPSSIPSPLSATNSPSINAKSAAPQTLVDDIAQEQEPSGSSTTESPVTTPSNSGPTLESVTQDGNKVSPDTTTKTTTPKKNVFTQLADSVQKFFSPKKPATSAPGSESSGPTPSDSTPQGSTSNAA